ncbi:SDR family NAD(P)-dependent oxidoreductase [Pseudomonas sp. NR3]|uniref:SDR family NAD(P)-dependent oxidoreductase n=1 Tax=Pseudomonas sp. NR3 TaxID=3155978 RepID=UPI003B673DBE
MGRRYWLTGAADGVGASLAEALLQTGAQLAIGSSKSSKLLSQRYQGQVLALPANMTNSQIVREVGQLISQQWGALDTVIINAGTAEYVEGQPADHTLVEHIVRSNLLAASFCVEVALPLLRQGVTPHLVGIASPVTYLAPSHAAGDGTTLRQVFESVRGAPSGKGIDVTLVIPGFDDPAMGLDGSLPIPTRWSAPATANYILAQLNERPHETPLPAASMKTLWPLPSSANNFPADTHPAGESPIKGQP